MNEPRCKWHLQGVDWRKLCTWNIFFYWLNYHCGFNQMETRSSMKRWNAEPRVFFSDEIDRIKILSSPFYSISIAIWKQFSISSFGKMEFNERKINWWHHEVNVFGRTMLRTTIFHAATGIHAVELLRKRYLLVGNCQRGLMCVFH